MAAITVTASSVTAPVPANHVGINTVVRTYTHGDNGGGVSFSASDVILVARIPNQAVIIDAYISGVTPSDATIWKLGTSLSDCAIIALGTLSATSQLKRADRPLPYKVSCSDDAIPQTVQVFATRVSGTATNTASIQFVIQYVVGGVNN